LAAQRGLTGIRANVGLLARVMGVVAMGFATTQLISHGATLLFVLGEPGDMTVVVVGELQSAASVPLELGSIGHDVLVFLGFL
jgi:hypothetical protein